MSRMQLRIADCGMKNPKPSFHRRIGSCELQNEQSEIRNPKSEMEGMLRTDGLVKRYGGRGVVEGVSVEVAQREVVGLLGPNGAGKTTTFYMIVGIVKPDAGWIVLDDRDITMLPMYRRARMGIGYLSQEPSIFRKLTVAENVMAILETRKLSKKERQDRLTALLDDFGLAGLAKTRAYRLSGGEKRRVEIARALVTEPRFILLDEPFTGIDPKTIEDIQNIIARLKERSTWLGLISLATAAGLGVSPELSQAIIAGGVEAGGVVAALMKDRP